MRWMALRSARVSHRPLKGKRRKAMSRLYVVDKLSDGWAVGLNNGVQPGVIVRSRLTREDAFALAASLEADAETGWQDMVGLRLDTSP